MKNISEYTQENLNMMSTPRLKDLLTDIINQREGTPDGSAIASQLDDLYLKVDNTINARKIYYIEIERQGGWTLAVVKVDAASREEAEAKALKAIHLTDDIYDISKESVRTMLKDGSIDYIIDEDGTETDIDGNEIDPLD